MPVKCTIVENRDVGLHGWIPPLPSLSTIPSSQASTVSLQDALSTVASALPRVVPATLVAKRQELLPLFFLTIADLADASARSVIPHRATPFRLRTSIIVGYTKHLVCNRVSFLATPTCALSPFFSWLSTPAQDCARQRVVPAHPQAHSRAGYPAGECSRSASCSHRPRAHSPRACASPHFPRGQHPRRTSRHGRGSLRCAAAASEARQRRP